MQLFKLLANIVGVPVVSAILAVGAAWAQSPATEGTTPDEVLGCAKIENLRSIMTISDDVDATIKLMKRLVAKRECALLPKGRNYTLLSMDNVIPNDNAIFTRIRLKGEPDAWWAVTNELR